MGFCFYYPLHVAGISKRLVGTFGSGPAVYAALKHGQPLGLMLDEAGQKLTAAAQRGAVHEASTLQAILELYGMGTGHFSGKRYAKTKGDVPPIDYPFLLPMLFSQPSTFIEAISSADADNGRIGRFLLVEDDEGAQPHNDEQQVEIPTAVREGLEKIRLDETDLLALRLRNMPGTEAPFLASASNAIPSSATDEGQSVQGPALVRGHFIEVEVAPEAHGQDVKAQVHTDESRVPTTCV